MEDKKCQNCKHYRSYADIYADGDNTNEPDEAGECSNKSGSRYREHIEWEDTCPEFELDE